MKFYCSFVLVFIIISCHGHSKPDVSKIKNEIENEKKDIVHENSKGILLNVDDSLFLSRIDTLFEKSFKDIDTVALSSLEKICLESDGYVSEYLMVKVGDYFQKEIKNLVGILYKNSGSCLEKRLIDEWGMNLSISGKDAKNNILSTWEASKNSFSLKERAFVQEMISRIDSKKWD